jgi:hypothetical protein
MICKASVNVFGLSDVLNAAVTHEEIDAARRAVRLRESDKLRLVEKVAFVSRKAKPAL